MMFMYRYLRSLLLLSLVLMPAAAAADESPAVDAGIVAVEAAVSTPGTGCAAVGTIEPPWGVCLVHHDGGEATDVGDDEGQTTVYVDEVGVTVRSGVVGEKEASLAFSDVSVEHPVFSVLNETWVQLNDTRPDAAKGWVSFESRPMRELTDDGEWRDTDRWGIFLLFHPSEDVPFVGGQRLAVFALCWSICYLPYNEATNETHVRPFADNVSIWASESTDHIVWRRFYETYNCYWMGPSLDKRHLSLRTACDHLAATHEHGDPAYATYQDLTPSYGIAFLQWNRTTVWIEDPSQAPPPPSHQPPHNHTHPSTPPHELHRATTPDQPRLTTSAAPPTFTPHDNGTTSNAFVWTGPTAATHTNTPPPHQTPWRLAAALAAGSLSLTFAWWLLYSRIGAHNALKQPMRRKIYDFIRDEPGLRVGTIADRLGLQYNSVKYHVRTLERVGLVRGSRGAQPRYVAAGARTEVAPPAALLSPAANRVMTTVRRRGRIPQGEVACLLHLAPSTVSDALQELESASLVTRQREGRRVVVALPVTAHGLPRERATAFS